LVLNLTLVFLSIIPLHLPRPYPPSRHHPPPKINLSGLPLSWVGNRKWHVDPTRGAPQGPRGAHGGWVNMCWDGVRTSGDGARSMGAPWGWGLILRVFHGYWPPQGEITINKRSKNTKLQIYYDLKHLLGTNSDVKWRKKVNHINNNENDHNSIRLYFRPELASGFTFGLCFFRPLFGNPSSMTFEPQDSVIS